MSFLTPQALRYIEENQQSLVDLIAHLCTIPAPVSYTHLPQVFRHCRNHARRHFARRWRTRFCHA